MNPKYDAHHLDFTLASTKHKNSEDNNSSANTKILCLAADCVYWESLFKPFVATLRSLVEEHNADVLVCHVKRWKKDERFFKMCRKHFQVMLVREHTNVEMLPCEGKNKNEDPGRSGIKNDYDDDDEDDDEGPEETSPEQPQRRTIQRIYRLSRKKQRGDKKM